MILGVALFASAAFSAGSDSSYVVDSVEVVRHNALEGSRSLVSADSSLYRWLQDNLHWMSTDAAIRGLLITAPGDSADALRISETARLLRTQRFLADASVTERQDSTGKHILRAETWDQWSLSLPLSISRPGGKVSWIVGVSEANLLGSGQQVGGYYSSTPIRTSWLLNYASNNFAMTSGRLAFAAANNSDGFSGSFEIGKPLRSRYDAWGVMISGARSSYTRIVDVPSDLRDQLQVQDPTGWPKGEAQWFLQPHSLRENLRLTLTVGGGQDVRILGSLIGEWYQDTVGRTSYQPAGGLAPSLLRRMQGDAVLRDWADPRPSRKDMRFGGSLQVKNVRYWSAHNFQNLKWTEDVPLGWMLESTYLINQQSDGDRKSAAWLKQAGSWSLLPYRDWYLAAGGAAEWFAGGETGPDQGAGTGKVEVRWFPRKNWQTLAAGSMDAAFFQKEAWAQYTLGEDNGLPGYSASELVGKSRMLLTVEERWTPPLEAFTVVPALAVFAGTGQISSTPVPWEGQGWKSGFGFGLRIGMSRSIDGVVNHLSVARPWGGASAFSLDPWVVSFGSRQSL